MLGNREWGEDALQLTFVAAYKALRRGRCDGALRPWLYAIARNRCLSELRTRREIPDSEAVTADGLTMDGPASLFARREQLREMVEDIQRLPADQRAALVLFELGDQSHAEIAAVLGVRRDKVKALIFQAREGLHRVRSARESACSDVQERVANARGKVPARGVVRAHIDRCAPCQAFERDVRNQRAALALIIPVALSGKLKALVLSSAFWHGGVGAGAAGASGAGSVAAASTASSGSGALGGPASLSAGAGASGGSVSGVVSAAAGSAAPTMVASALAPETIAGVGAKIAAVVVLAVGVGGVARTALQSSPQPQVSSLAGKPNHAAALRSPFQPLVSGIKNPLVVATEQGLPRGAGAAALAGAPAKGAPGETTSSSIPGPASWANSTAVSASSAPGPGAASPTGTTSAPAASAPGQGTAATTAPSRGTSATTTTASSPTASSPTASSPTASSGSSSTFSASPGNSGASQGNSGNSPGHTGQPGENSGNGTGNNGHGLSSTPSGCVNNPSPGCVKKGS
jgi:RNA polymerase sigma factor (sigma-70 family)